MCGIAGLVSLRDGLAAPRLDTLKTMAGVLRHRGPDELGIYRDERAGLAHARLSIIDIATGQQPLSNEEGTLWIVLNGEIFNYLELRAELEALGHRFRTHSDTEVIVHAFEAWGTEAFGRFNGQFAVALWDSSEQRLVLARDRLGVRPLYFCEQSGRLAFASEVKAIFAADPSFPRAFDPIGLDETFTFWTVVPPQSVFEGVRELEPGHVKIVERNGTSRELAFWEPRYASEGWGFSGPLEEAVERVRAVLERAVELRMLRADVPVGSYLSGGLDSSLVAALGRRARGGRFCTFSLRFEDSEYDETQFQRQMTRMLESDHQELMIGRNEIAQVFPEVVEHAERPLLRTAPAPLFLLSKLVQQAGIKVVLTGEGADEMFAGYDLFREAKVRRFWGRQPASLLRPRLLERLYPYLERSPVAQQSMARKFFGQGLEHWAAPGFSHQPRWRSTAALKRLFSAEMRRRLAGFDAVEHLLSDLPKEMEHWHALAQDQYLEVRTLLSGYLLSSQGDRMLMAHSVEGRFPFLDTELVELANSLPPHYKLRRLDEKHVLKRASEGLVPQAIIRRPKQPYRAPDALSFTAPTRPEWVDEVLAESSVREVGVFDPGAVSTLWAKCRERQTAPLSNADNMALVGVLSTQLLHRQLIQRVCQSPPVGVRISMDRLSKRGVS